MDVAGLYDLLIFTAGVLFALSIVLAFYYEYQKSKKK